MPTLLLNAVRHYFEAQNGAQQRFNATPIQGLNLVRATQPSAIEHAIWGPLICLVLQGEKHVSFGVIQNSYAAGASILLTTDLPTVSQITQASAATPYLSMVIDLDLATIAELVAEMASVASSSSEPVCTGAEVAKVALRLMQLLERPEAMAILHKTLMRELHYWLLAGQLGKSIALLGRPDSHARRIARAVSILRAEYAQRIPVARLANAAGMSASSFHQHFRAVTSLSPQQFQKQLRLIEARRLMLANGLSASRAAFAVGYQSVPQFTREFGRMYGNSPAREAMASVL